VFAIRPRRAAFALIKLVAVLAAAAAGYAIGTGWAHHEYGVIVAPAAALVAHLAVSDS
jgi:hypothetical protein